MPRRRACSTGCGNWIKCSRDRRWNPRCVVTERNELLAGRVALITGGGGEIGGAIATRFAEAGAAIVVADVRRDAAEQVAAAIAKAGGDAVAVRTNVAIAEDAERSVRHAVEAFGKLTTLVNAAANV